MDGGTPTVVGKSQPVLMMINPIIFFPHTRTCCCMAVSFPRSCAGTIRGCAKRRSY
jgi:hypothetical protein